MIKNNTSTIILGLIMLISFYLLYDSQDSTEQKLIALEKQLSNLEGKIDSHLKEEIISSQFLLDYKESNSITKDIDEFSENLNDKIQENKRSQDNFYDTLSFSNTVIDSSNIIQETKDLDDDAIIDSQSVSEPLDTLCYGLAEKYTIIIFNKNSVRLREWGDPKSLRVYVKDTLDYDSLKYVVLEINAPKEHILLRDLNNNKNCYFLK